MQEKLRLQIERAAIECNAGMVAETAKVAERAAEAVARQGVDCKEVKSLSLLGALTLRTGLVLRDHIHHHNG